MEGKDTFQLLCTGFSLAPLLFYAVINRQERWQEEGRTSLRGDGEGGLLILKEDPYNTLIKSLQRDPPERESYPRK